MQEQEGFVLLALPNCSISALGRKVSGQLELDCVTVNQSVVLVLRLENLEYPIDPTNPIYPQQASSPGSKSYVFTNASDGQILLTVSPPNNANELEFYAEDVQTFEGVLTQYADFRASEDAPSPTLNDTKRPVPPPPTTRNSVSSNSHAPPPSHPNQVRSPPQSSKSMPTPPAHPSQAAIPEANASPIYSSELNDYKGQLVLVNEEDGHVVGQFDDKLHISADPTILQRGHEKDPVIIEVNEDEGEGNARECFIRAIPPEQHDWMTKGASIVR
jgi:spartin